MKNFVTLYVGCMERCLKDKKIITLSEYGTIFNAVRHIQVSMRNIIPFRYKIDAIDDLIERFYIIVWEDKK